MANRVRSMLSHCSRKLDQLLDSGKAACRFPHRLVRDRVDHEDRRLGAKTWRSKMVPRVSF